MTGIVLLFSVLFSGINMFMCEQLQKYRYTLYRNPVTWYEANTTCYTHGGSLLKLNTTAKFSIIEFFQKTDWNDTVFGDYWVGLTKVFAPDMTQYAWTDGSLLENAIVDTQSTGGNVLGDINTCVRVKQSTGNLTDTFCQLTFAFICQNTIGDCTYERHNNTTISTVDYTYPYIRYKVYFDNIRQCKDVCSAHFVDSWAFTLNKNTTPDICACYATDDLGDLYSRLIPTDNRQTTTALRICFEAALPSDDRLTKTTTQYIHVTDDDNSTAGMTDRPSTRPSSQEITSSTNSVTAENLDLTKPSTSLVASDPKWNHTMVTSSPYKPNTTVQYSGTKTPFMNYIFTGSASSTIVNTGNTFNVVSPKTGTNTAKEVAPTESEVTTTSNLASVSHAKEVVSATRQSTDVDSTESSSVVSPTTSYSTTAMVATVSSFTELASTGIDFVSTENSVTGNVDRINAMSTESSSGNDTSSSDRSCNLSGKSSPNCSCRCMCPTSLTQEESMVFMSHILRSLDVERKHVSSWQQRFTSAQDNRVSAQSIGYLGAGFLAFVFGGMLLIDLTGLKQCSSKKC